MQNSFQHVFDNLYSRHNQSSTSAKGSSESVNSTNKCKQRYNKKIKKKKVQQVQTNKLTRYFGIKQRKRSVQQDKSMKNNQQIQNNKSLIQFNKALNSKFEDSIRSFQQFKQNAINVLKQLFVQNNARKKQLENIQMEFFKLFPKDCSFQYQQLLKKKHSIFNQINQNILNQKYSLLALKNYSQYSEIVEAVDLTDLRKVYIKIVLQRKEWNEDMSKQFLNERVSQFKRQAQHPRLIRIKQLMVKQEGKRICYIVFERYFQKGNILQYIRGKEQAQVEKQVVNILKQILEILSSLHNNNRIFFNLKPSNVFIDSGTVYLTDIGLNRLKYQKKLRTVALKQSIYSAPQQLSDFQIQITTKVDLWSVGMIAYELLYGINPDVQQNVIFPQHPKICKQLKVIMGRWLRWNYLQRMSADQSLKCKIFQILK